MKNSAKWRNTSSSSPGTWSFSSGHSTGSPGPFDHRTCRTFPSRQPLISCWKRYGSSGEPACPLNPEGSGPPAACHGSAFEEEFPSTFKRSPGRRSASGATPAGADSFDRASTRTGNSGMNLSTRVSEMIASWSPPPDPEWVTCIPSLRHPDLVPGVRRAPGGPARVALPSNIGEDRESCRTEVDGQQHATGEQRGWIARVLSRNPIPDGPVLLVDDMVDSRWTMTAAAWLLRSNGSGRVWPLALAFAGYGG